MSKRRTELVVLLGAAIAIAVVILVTLYVLDRRADPNADADIDGRTEIGTPIDKLRESGGPPLPDRGSHPVPSPG